jgi:trk system potassium uptake protein TrkA
MDRKEDVITMRIVFVGAGKLSIMTAEVLLHHNHEIVIIELDKEQINSLSSTMDCGFIHGDGSRPAVLREADPAHSDYLLCLTGSDQTNIIAGLVGRSLGFQNVVTKIEDHELEHICTELGLDNIIIPTNTISRYLTDFIEGRDILELSSMIKGDARFFSFVVREASTTIEDLKLPENANIICYYRDGNFNIAAGSTKLKDEDEVIVITDSGSLPRLKEWLSDYVA